MTEVLRPMWPVSTRRAGHFQSTSSQCLKFTGIASTARNQTPSNTHPNNQRVVLQYQNTRVRAQRARDASASEHPGVARGRSPPFRKFWPAGAGQLKICNACCTRWRRRLSRPARPAIHQSCRCARCPAPQPTTCRTCPSSPAGRARPASSAGSSRRRRCTA